jgi:hypothetical protein
MVHTDDILIAQHKTKFTNHLQKKQRQQGKHSTPREKTKAKVKDNTKKGSYHIDNTKHFCFKQSSFLS